MPTGSDLFLKENILELLLLLFSLLAFINEDREEEF